MTGQYQQRHGFEFLAPEGPNAKGLLPDQRLFAEQLQKSGYRTAAVGKWHLGSTPDQLPTARGFDSFFGFLPGELAFISAGRAQRGKPARALPRRTQFPRSREWTQLIRSSAGQRPWS
jgi:arylsulfatase A-like enzyme